MSFLKRNSRPNTRAYSSPYIRSLDFRNRDSNGIQIVSYMPDGYRELRNWTDYDDAKISALMARGSGHQVMIEDRGQKFGSTRYRALVK